MKTVTTHYGEPGYAASCGVRWPKKVSVDRKDVTCWSCRRTRHWRTRFWENCRVKEES